MLLRVLLLPGLDGSGELFGEFSAALPEPVAYPSERALDYDALEAEQRATRFPVDAAPTLIVAESFSGPLAIRLAEAPPLRAVVLAEPERGADREGAPRSERIAEGTPSLSEAPIGRGPHEVSASPKGPRA